MGAHREDRAVSGWDAPAVLRRQLRETRRTPGRGWVVGAAVALPALAVTAVATFARWRGMEDAGRLVAAAWLLPATTLVGALSAVAAATSIAGRAEAGVLDAMRRHGVAVERTLAGKRGAAAVVGLALLVATLPGALLALAAGAPALTLAIGAAGAALAAIVGATVGVAIGARQGQVPRAVAASAGVMALVPLAVVATTSLIAG